MKEEDSKWFHEEPQRIRPLYHEARKLGQDEKAKQLEHGLYGFSFGYHQQLLEESRKIKELANLSNGDSKRILEEGAQKISSNAERLASSLEEFVSKGRLTMA